MPDYQGTAGNDSYWGGPDADHIEGLGGNDYLVGNGGDDEILGGDGDDNLHGGEGNDELDGGEGNDSLQGNQGTDVLRGMGGDDRLLLNPESGITSLTGESLDGGDGIDTLQFDGLFLTSSIVFSIADSSVAQDLYGATVINIERLAFRSGSGNDDITGGALDDNIDGYDGNDRIDGGLGDDNLNGGAGTDTIYGGGGNDTIRGGSGGTNDTLYGGDGDDTFFWNEDELIDGGAGVDHLRIDYSVAGSDLTADLSNPNVETMVLGTRVIGVEQLSFYAGSGNDHLTGGAGDDLLVGNGGDDTLIGGAGNDNLAGGDGNDQLSGGAGDDFLQNFTYDTIPADVIDGGEGFDTLEFWATSATGPITIDLLATSGMVTNVEQINFTGGFGTSHVSGGAADDIISGGDADDHFDGRGGNDTLRGGYGEDELFGGSGNDYVEGGADADSLVGGTGDDVLRGEEGNDSLDGGDGADELGGGFDNDLLAGGTGGDYLDGGYGVDELDGGAGSDTLIGGAGSDMLAGGSEGDTFRGTVADMSGDTITDFTVGDRIVFTDASLDTFTYSLSGSTLTYSGGSLTLSGVTGTLVATATPSGDVQLALEPVVRAKLILTESGQDFTIGGNVEIFGTAAGGEVIEVLRGDILLDASFNLGGDTVVLPGAAGSYTAILSGSFVTISGGDISVAIPVGAAGLAVQFSDSTRTLRFDSGAGEVMLGTQSIGTTAEAVAASGPPLVDAAETGPDSLAKLILTAPGQDVDIGGNVAIFGTASGGEVINVLEGTIQLDASFNLGGDTVVLPGNANTYTATLSGSFVTIASGDISVAIPVGLAGLTVDFGDVDRTLRYDPDSGQVLLGTQAITGTTQPVAAPAGGEPLFAAALDSIVDGLGGDLDWSGPDHAYLVPDHSARMEFQRLEMIDSFQFG